MLQDLKKFLMRGNVVDLAVAVVIGVAFQAVVTAFVDNIINPIIAAVVFFLVVKPVNAVLERFRQDEAAAPTAPTPELSTLLEIRDLLREARAPRA